MRGRDLSNFRNTRALGVSNQTPPFLYGLYLSHSFFPLALYSFRSTATTIALPSRASLLSLLSPPSILDPRHPFHALSRYIPSLFLVVSFPFRFRSSAGSARPMIPDFSIPWLPAGTRCLSEVRTRKKSPKGNIVPGIENRISQGIGFIRIVVYISLR